MCLMQRVEVFNMGGGHVTGQLNPESIRSPGLGDIYRYLKYIVIFSNEICNETHHQHRHSSFALKLQRIYKKIKKPF